jgi:ADP-ribosylation factor-like protein 3
MGLLRLLQQMRRSDHECRILLLGLDNAGKTTILKSLCNEDPSETSPTRGFNVKTIQADSFKFNVWDIGGQREIRQYWDNYYENTDALVWVVDCADEGRLEETSLELTQLLADTKLANVPVLIFANKQDLSIALPPDQVTVSLDLHKIRDHAWQIQGCSALSGNGLDDGLKWLVQAIK